MAPNSPRLRILSVGGNAVSAFLSWRLQATNACDVTLVWKSGFESVAQYGISFRSNRFGNERFKPRQVVRTPEEAAHTQAKGSFDYVLLCVKALPDVYDLASVIESVVTPQHTCILINTSHSLGVEALIEERYPKNVVLSLVSHAEINQLGPSEFEHTGATNLWVGPANWNPSIPVSIQSDMAEALAMTLGSGQVECTVSKNIQQQQFECMIGPIAFHPTSVLFETPNHSELLELTGVRAMVTDVVEEVIRIAEGRGCTFPPDTKDKTMQEMISPKDNNSIMYQDYTAKRPMEVETYLGTPVKLAREAGVKVPRIETLYAMLHHVNIANQKRPAPPPQAAAIEPAPTSAPPTMARMSSTPAPRGPPPPGPQRPSYGGPPPPGPGRPGSRAPSMTGPPPPGPPGRRGPPPGFPPNGMPPRGPPPHMQRRPSFEANGLDEFSHVVLYDSPNDSFVDGANYGEPNSPSDLAAREREMMLRQKELELREREMTMNMRGGPPPGRGPRPPPSHAGGFDDDEEDGEDYFDPMAYRGPPVDPDNVDMMSITSKRNRKQPSISQLRQNPEMGGPPRRGNPFRPAAHRNRASSARLMNDMGGIHENVLDNPMMGYSSDRYGGFDRKGLGTQSRTNSLTAARLDELQQGQQFGGYPPMSNSRRTSQSPGNPFGPNGRPQGRPSPPGHAYPPTPNGIPPNGRPSPDMRQPIPRHPPGHGNSVAPHEVEQRAGVSNLYPPKNGPQSRSLTGSASASAGSGDSGRSNHFDSENSAYSSQSSLGPRPPIGVR